MWWTHNFFSASVSFFFFFFWKQRLVRVLVFYSIIHTARHSNTQFSYVVSSKLQCHFSLYISSFSSNLLIFTAHNCCMFAFNLLELHFNRKNIAAAVEIIYNTHFSARSVTLSAHVLKCTRVCSHVYVPHSYALLSLHLEMFFLSFQFMPPGSPAGWKGLWTAGLDWYQKTMWSFYSRGPWRRLELDATGLELIKPRL